MKRLLVAGLVAGVAMAFAPPAANASDPPYLGGCGFQTMNDTTPGGQLGGQDQWNGVIRLVVVPTDTTTGAPSGATATVSCELRIEGVSQGTVLGPVTGTGVVADAGGLTFHAAITDVLTLCNHVQIGSDPEIVDCTDLSATIILPGYLLNWVLYVAHQTVDIIIDTVIDLLNELGPLVDPTVCGVLIALAPTVNGLGHPELSYIDPVTGDWYVGGTTSPDDLFWDCPPYAS